MTKRTIEQILDELRRGRRPLLADKPAESDASRYDCLRCKDQGGYLVRQNGCSIVRFVMFFHPLMLNCGILFGLLREKSIFNEFRAVAKSLDCFRSGGPPVFKSLNRVSFLKRLSSHRPHCCHRRSCHANNQMA